MKVSMTASLHIWHISGKKTTFKNFTEQFDRSDKKGQVRSIGRPHGGKLIQFCTSHITLISHLLHEASWPRKKTQKLSVSQLSVKWGLMSVIQTASLLWGQMEKDWDAQVLSPAALGTPGGYLSTRQPFHSSVLQHAHSLCILLSQLFMQAGGSSAWHSNALPAVTNEVCHHLAARKRRHPETEIGVVPKHRGRHKLQAADHGSAKAHAWWAAS